MTLDAAWAEAHEALGEHWLFDGLVPYPANGEGWLARAKTKGQCKCCLRGRIEYGHGFGSTPDAALTDLAKTLRKKAAA